VLFKSSKISESKGNQALFHQLIDALSVSDIELIKNQSNIKILQNAFAFFEAQKIGINRLIERIKNAFDDKKCLCTNNDKELEVNQKRLNNLEDGDNSIRAIFTVDKLNEGWDVLNLFDIVRLYEGQSTGGSNKGKIGKKTVSEAQLIGRGARYCAFKINDDDDPYIRKFDNDIENELRILEELYFHSSNDSQYISEIQKALIEQGLLEKLGEEPIVFKLELKDKIKHSDNFKNKLIFKNKRVVKKYNHIKSISDFGIQKSNFCYEMENGKGSLLEIFNDAKEVASNKKIRSCNLVNLLSKNILKNAMLMFDSFSFSNLKIPFENINSINDFFNNDYLGKFKIDISGDIDDLSSKQKLTIALSFLSALEVEIKGNTAQYEGTKSFYP
jgi:type III restriction enzyme